MLKYIQEQLGTQTIRSRRYEQQVQQQGIQRRKTSIKRYSPVSKQTIFKSWHSSPIIGRAVFSAVLIATYLAYNHSQVGERFIRTRVQNRTTDTYTADSVRRKPKEVYTAQIVQQYPHDHMAYTQGLFFSEKSVVDHGNGTSKSYDNVFYESTGKVLQNSDIRLVDLTSGQVIKKTQISSQYFAEGLVLLKSKLYQLLWKTNKGFIYDPLNLSQIGEFHTPLKDGWGLTTDGRYLIATDSSSRLYWMDPEDNFKIVKTVNVTETIFGNTLEVPWVNELDYINNEIWANLYMKDCICRIDPANGNVNSWVLLGHLKQEARKSNLGYQMDVLNGIAYDPKTQRLFVTGKNWPTLFEIKLVKLDLSQEEAQNNIARCIPHVRGIFF